MPKISSRKERGRLNDLLYGRGAKAIPPRMLPSKGDVDLSVEFFLKKGYREAEAVAKTANDIVTAYRSLTDIVVSLKSVTLGVKAVRIRRLGRVKQVSIDKRTGDMREGSGKKRKGKGKRQLPSGQNFLDWANTLFYCPKEVPPYDLEFIEDQKGARKMRRNPRVIPEPDPAPSTATSSGVIESDLSESEPDSDSDSDFVPESPAPKKAKKILPPNLLDSAERYSMSSAAIAACFNDTSSNGITYTSEGVRKSRNRARAKAGCPDLSNLKIIGLGCDERQDLTDFGLGDCRKEEHASVIVYTGKEEINVGYFVPEAGTGASLANGLFLFCRDRKMSLTSLYFLVTDGCSKMKGWKTGFHVEFEKLVQRELVRVFCFFHHYEKTFESLFKFHGGETTGPSSLTPEWQTLIRDNVHKGDIVNFRRIDNPFVLSLVDDIPKGAKLSSDHEIFVALVGTICSGKDSSKVHRKIGPMNHARMTTTETRALSAYIRTGHPPEYLIRIVNYLINVFAPVFCLSKIFYKSHFMAPKLLLLEAMLCKKHLSINELQKASKSLDINGQMGANENIILCCLSSPDSEERTLGVETVLRIRNKASSLQLPKNEIRPFMPNDYRVNVKATGLHNLNMIPLNEARYEPPVTKCLSDQEILNFLHSPFDASGIPLSSVAVERAVKDTTRASMMARTTVDRNGVIQMTIRARAKSNNKINNNK